MRVLYNDMSVECARWLKQLCADKLISDGDVVCSDFANLDAETLCLYDRVHLFAGIGGWDLALNNAGWGDQKVWTASLPCQPFSKAGKKRGYKDERHLLPKFIKLVNKCKPRIIFGEQVEKAIEQNWLDDLQTNLETEGYSFGAVVLGAHSIGAAHIRQRIYWVAHSSDYEHRQAVTTGFRKEKGEEIKHREDFVESRKFGGADSTILHRNTVNATSRTTWVTGRDGKTRPIESGIPLLAHGVSERMVSIGGKSLENIRIRGYGNAIVIGCAVEFILANMEYMRYRQLL